MSLSPCWCYVVWSLSREHHPIKVWLHEMYVWYVCVCVGGGKRYMCDRWWRWNLFLNLQHIIFKLLHLRILRSCDFSVAFPPKCTFIKLSDKYNPQVRYKWFTAVTHYSFYMNLVWNEKIMKQGIIFYENLSSLMIGNGVLKQRVRLFFVISFKSVCVRLLNIHQHIFRMQNGL